MGRPVERWPKVIAWAVFVGEHRDGSRCQVRVQVGGYGREVCEHGAALRLSHVGTQEDAL